MRMKRWVDLMGRHATDHINKYNDVLFEWLRTQILMVDDYAYVRIDFRGDLDLALTEGSQWGDTSKTESSYNVFVIFKDIKCFLCSLSDD
jgi:hypothetical protein